MFFLENTEHIFHIFKLHNFNIFQARFQIRIPKNSARISRFVDIHWIPMLLSGLPGRSTKESPNPTGSTQSSEPPNAPTFRVVTLEANLSKRRTPLGAWPCSNQRPSCNALIHPIASAALPLCLCVCVRVPRYNKQFSSVFRTRTILIKQGAEEPVSLPLPKKLGGMW